MFIDIIKVLFYSDLP